MTESNVPPPGPNDPYDTAPPAAPPPPPNPAMLNPAPTAPPPPPPGGAPLGYAGPMTGYPGSYNGPPPDENAKTMGMLCHLSAIAAWFVALPFLGPLIVWLLKKQEHPFIDDQGKEALNFQITVAIVFVILTPTLCIAIGIVLLPLVAVAGLIFTIIGGVKAKDGVPYRYPMTFRFIK